VLEAAGADAVAPALPRLFGVLAKCVGSPHFQVAERALLLWRGSDALCEGVLGRACAPAALPLLFAPLSRQAAGHWNPNVEALALSVLKHYQSADAQLFDRCAAAHQAAASEAHQARARADRWHAIEAAALAKARPPADAQTTSAAAAVQ
jgi:serine/threonine-protein phosphatase 2A regulatory subunit B'